MAIWLIDSRSRVSTGKRYVWIWDDDNIHANREAWQLVLNAEVREQKDRDDYRVTADNDMRPDLFPDEAHELIEMFNDFWSIYGWHLALMDNDDVPEAADIKMMYLDEPARECFVLWEPCAHSWRFDDDNIEVCARCGVERGETTGSGGSSD